MALGGAGEKARGAQEGNVGGKWEKMTSENWLGWGRTGARVRKIFLPMGRVSDVLY